MDREILWKGGRNPKTLLSACALSSVFRIIPDVLILITINVLQSLWVHCLMADFNIDIIV
jgi:hypothetical protein